MRLEKFDRFDVDVAVGDQGELSAVVSSFKKLRAKLIARSLQYNGTFGSTVRAQPSMPPRID
jgi:hypothetical protein